MPQTELKEILEKYELQNQFSKVTSASPYVVETLERYSAEFAIALENKFWFSAINYDKPRAGSLPYLDDIANSETENACKQALRKFRNFHSARLLWLDLNSLIEWQDLLKAQSDLADLCVQSALSYLQKEFIKKYQKPRYADDKLMQLSVIAMGKWGGRELNFSSDIDFILVYGEKAKVQGIGNIRAIETHQYFTKVSQRLIRLLDEKTADGFVYRCDTRLRPFGDSGPLVVSISALEQYLTQHGREWERYAYLKARCITGDQTVKSDFEMLRKPFVYRRYLDYGVFSKLRDMHAQIALQVKKKEMQGNLKLGSGGIRECEFLVQAIQLLRGGRTKALQCTSFYQAYEALQVNDIWIDKDNELFTAYAFLRIIENRLQAIQQEQTHQLPEDPNKRQFLVSAMQEKSWEELFKKLNVHRQIVSKIFSQQMVLLNINNDDSVVETDFYTSLTELETSNPEVFSQTVKLQSTRLYKNLSEPGREKLHDLFILFFAEIDKYKDKPKTDYESGIRNFYNIIQSIGRRTVYFSLLVERPAALEHLLQVCFKSEYLCEQIALRPILLDELLDMRLFQQAPSRQAIIAASYEVSLNAKESNLEQFVNDLVVHKHVQMFRIACAEIFQKFPLMKVSDCLSDLAESILEIVCQRILKETLEKYLLSELTLEESGFAILAYGKLGGLELSYTSDLDIVFLYDLDSVKLGHKLHNDEQIRNRFYTRMVQQCISYLNMPTSMGRLYEVDTRLRPSGKSGFLISSIEAFEQYQRNEAWVWEHQALIRSRVVLGASKLAEKIDRIRLEILTTLSSEVLLKDEVIKMRDRMRTQFELDNPKLQDFHLKHSVGGMIDLEFLVQYLVLEYGRKFPVLLEFSDNIRQLESFANCGILKDSDVQDLITAYIKLREHVHLLSLHSKPPIISHKESEMPKRIVIKHWQDVFN